MKQVYAVNSQDQLKLYHRFYERHSCRMGEFVQFLQTKLAVSSLPRCIVWTDYDTATHSIGDIPIPAYTNDYRTVFCPELQTWQEIYLHQLDNLDHPEIREYYETKLTENHVLQILGHEFVHHSDLFPENTYEHGIWFEEGMCEYISRKFFLTEKEFQEEACINRLLVELLNNKYGEHPLDDFGAATYSGDYASIFFEYWRSFLAVDKIVRHHNGDIMTVFNRYHSYQQNGAGESLAQWFGI